MRDCPPEPGLLRNALPRKAEACEKTRRRECRDPSFEFVVRHRALPAQFVEIGVKFLVERANTTRSNRATLDFSARKSSHPYAVGDENMVERCMNRLEECATISLTLGIRELRRNVVDLLVH